jgi:hypothetical protein
MGWIDDKAFWFTAGGEPARVLMRARVLLKADEGMGETAIAQALDIHPRTGEKVGSGFAKADSTRLGMGKRSGRAAQT